MYYWNLLFNTHGISEPDQTGCHGHDFDVKYSQINKKKYIHVIVIAIISRIEVKYLHITMCILFRLQFWKN